MSGISTNNAQIVLSVSRRTDIPAFYLSWFMQGIDWGHFDVTNPFSQKVKRVPADPDSVHSLVFWSKNFGPFLSQHIGEALQRRGYHLFFNYTLNSESPLLEPCVPPLENRLDQLEELCRRFGPQTVNWRFDPICYFRHGNGPMQTNLSGFLSIAERAGAVGIQRCITSFMDHYPKIARRLTEMPELEFLDPPPDKKVATLLWMGGILRPMGIALYTCCETDIIKTLPVGSGIQESACIPNSLLVKIYGGKLALKRDPGQRRRMGCRCQVSVDIGSYRDHPCDHDCRYCYANPSRKAPVAVK